MPLTDTTTRSTKPGQKPIRLLDGGGLYLDISQNGGRRWRFKYRNGGKEKRLSPGVYPDTPFWARVHGGRILRRFVRDNFPWIGGRRVTEVSAPELLSLLGRIESRGAIDTAHRASSNCGQAFRNAGAAAATAGHLVLSRAAQEALPSTAEPGGSQIFAGAAS
jgi:hypothetical protein